MKLLIEWQIGNRTIQTQKHCGPGTIASELNSLLVDYSQQVLFTIQNLGAIRPSTCRQHSVRLLIAHNSSSLLQRNWKA